MVRPPAVAALICALALPPAAQAGRAGEARAESRRQETDKAVDQILSGQGIQSAISRILFLGNQAYATALMTRALERFPDVHTKQNIAFAFSLLGAKNGEQPLYTLVRDEDAGVRMNALQALTKLHSADPKKIGPLLKDKNMGVRREAARALGAAHRSQDSQLLIAAARAEDEPEVRAAMLIALGDTGDKKQVRALEGFLKSSSESTRFAATQALCRLGAPSGFQLAHKLLTSSDRWERRHGLALFEGAKAKDADKMLRPMLRDPDPAVAAIAARILYQGGDEKMLEWMVVTSARSSTDARLAYETELEQLHLADDRRKQILAKAGIKAPAQ